MKPVLFILGTRPEAIKLLPLLWECQKKKLPFELLHTDQHRELLDSLLNFHSISPDYRLSLFGRFSDLSETKAAMLRQITHALSAEKFSSVIVQGDTLSALVGAEYGFLHGLPVVHIEAGMRTYQSDDPYPEEAFRRMIGALSHLHFCPSEDEAKNLLREGISMDRIFVVGNTFADYWRALPTPDATPKKQILITIHRRENLPFLNGIFEHLAEIATELREYEFLFPIHPNPTIVNSANACLGKIPNIRLLPPLAPDDFYRELLSSELVVTDSGGVQEECIFHAKKILVLRKVSERQTNFDFSRLIDPESPSFREAFFSLLSKRTTATHSAYYGSGGAAREIAEILESRYFSLGKEK